MLLALVQNPLVTHKPIDITEYLFLAEAVASKLRQAKGYRTERIQDTEIYSIACLELVTAAKNYDPTVCGDFSRYAYKCMRNKIISFFKYNKAKKRFVKYEELIDDQLSQVPAKKESALKPLETNLLDVILSSSPQDTEQDVLDKNLLKEIYLSGQTVSSIAEKYNVTRMTLYNRIKRITTRLQERYSDLIEKNS